MRVAFLVRIVLLLGLAAAASPAATITRYFAIRTDGRAGDGSAGNPFDGSAFRPAKTGVPARNADGWVSRFDQRMNALTKAQRPGNRYEYVLAPGVYWSAGDDDNPGTRGYLLPPDTTLRGAGMGATIISYAGWSWGRIHSVIAAGTYAPASPRTAHHARAVVHDNVTVRDLTVRCNPDLLGMNPASRDGVSSGNAIYGVALAGNNCTIRNVEVVNPYGVQASTYESFAISIFANDVRNITGGRIEGCVVRDAIGNYVTAIILGGSILRVAGQPDGPPVSASGVVTNNVVVGGAYVAYSGGYTVDSIYSNNVCRDVQFGFRYDTGTFRNAVFINNVFSSRQGAFVMRPDTNGGAATSDITLIGNSLFADGTPGMGELNVGVISLQRPVSNFGAFGNRIFSGDRRANLRLDGGATISEVTFSNHGAPPRS